MTRCGLEKCPSNTEIENAWVILYDKDPGKTWEDRWHFMPFEYLKHRVLCENGITTTQQVKNFWKKLYSYKYTKLGRLFNETDNNSLDRR